MNPYDIIKSRRLTENTPRATLRSVVASRQKWSLTWI